MPLATTTLRHARLTHSSLAPRTGSFEPEADLDCRLNLRGLPLLHASAYRHTLEPIDVAQRLARIVDRGLNGLRYVNAGGSGDLYRLIHRVGDLRLLSHLAAGGDQVPFGVRDCVPAVPFDGCAHCLAVACLISTE
jgi:hypothetical protein